jgi:histidinol-phosphate aminotransferase
MRDTKQFKDISRRNFIGTITGAAAIALIGLDRKALAGFDGFPAGEVGPDIARDFTARICYNENPLGPSPAAAEALINVAYLAHRYPDWYGESLIANLAAHHGLSSSMFIVGSGATEILRLCALAFASIGGNVIVPSPSYSQFPTDCQLFGRTVRYVSHDSNHRVSLSDIANRVDSNTSAICITNPENPTGTIVDDGELADFVQSLDSDIVTIIDEAYLEYISESGYTSAVELVRQGRNVVVVKTFSKVYGLAGARIGYAIGSASNINAMRRYQYIATVSGPCLEAARAGLGDQEHITQTVQLASQTKSHCFGQFALMGLSYIPSESSFFMVDVGTNADPVRVLLAEREIYVRTGWGMNQHLRVSTGTQHEMERFIYELGDILSSMPLGDSPVSLRSTDLYQATPNPFNSTTMIRVYVPSPQEVRLDIYDIQGRLVRQLCDRSLGTGEHAFEWNGTNYSGAAVATGAYFYRMTAGESVITRKMLLIK